MSAMQMQSPPSTEAFPGKIPEKKKKVGYRDTYRVPVEELDHAAVDLRALLGRLGCQAEEDWIVALLNGLALLLRLRASESYRS